MNESDIISKASTLIVSPQTALSFALQLAEMVGKWEISYSVRQNAEINFIALQYLQLRR